VWLLSIRICTPHEVFVRVLLDSTKGQRHYASTVTGQHARKARLNDQATTVPRLNQATGTDAEHHATHGITRASLAVSHPPPLLRAPVACFHCFSIKLNVSFAGNSRLLPRVERGGRPTARGRAPHGPRNLSRQTTRVWTRLVRWMNGLACDCER
jgi:hypothetical protein